MCHRVIRAGKALGSQTSAIANSVLTTSHCCNVESSGMVQGRLPKLKAALDLLLAGWPDVMLSSSQAAPAAAGCCGCMQFTGPLGGVAPALLQLLLLAVSWLSASSISSAGHMDLCRAGRKIGWAGVQVQRERFGL